MNERIRELAEQAGLELSTVLKDSVTPVKSITIEQRKFAELIVRDCDRYARSVWEHGPLLGRDLLIYFGIEEPGGWVCPKCGIDRTREACPKGHSAALTGDCPMVGEAQ